MTTCAPLIKHDPVNLSDFLINCHRSVKKLIAENHISKTKGNLTTSSNSNSVRLILQETVIIQLKQSGIHVQAKECIGNQKLFTEEEINKCVSKLNHETYLGNWKKKEVTYKESSYLLVYAEHEGAFPGIIFRIVNKSYEVCHFSYRSEKYKS